MPEATGPLAGVKIVDMSTVVLGPFATLILADLGAEVIKIENGKGDVMRHAGAAPTPAMGPIFTCLNRNKKSVCLDAKTEEGKAALTELLKDADVFFHNVRMAGMERLGFAYEDVCAINPDIVYVHCAGYGKGGRYETRQAYDDLIQVASGFADLLQMRDGGEPAYIPSLIADKTIGLYAVYATIAALFHKQKSGEGQFVQIPMFEAFTFFHMVENLYGETWLPGNGRMAYTRSINKNRKPYKTQNGYIGLVPYSDEQWELFFQIGGRPEVFSDPRFSTYEARTQNIGELYALIEEVAATKTTEVWLELLEDAQIPVMGFNSNMDVLTDPHLTDVGFFEERAHPAGGSYRAMKHPVSFSKTPASIRSDPPQLGQDTETVLSQLGLGATFD
ncbi:CaiB/BaiF CoA-transferase family protein [Ponticaulis sp.]|uniref:CaiB/BaiF CoA transferase family protein n=1 Tax=Ponticaulis sp. TaxID=2020902 RepID=UPI000B70233D|nr:CoA transferase [Ponticaulis sp.]MAI91938.1 carnitine dehydratase [Ponticaulis sp.]OUX96412.1 MAG: carnitine dehydratase [Hyphomonadaceae bacterium TMED5]|tara:strand:+ start:14803 stop:15972 length:1170 start_codon:yes stop_codon:yes gene_type:complete